MVFIWHLEIVLWSYYVIQFAWAATIYVINLGTVQIVIRPILRAFFFNPISNFHTYRFLIRVSLRNKPFRIWIITDLSPFSHSFNELFVSTVCSVLLPYILSIFMLLYSYRSSSSIPSCFTLSYIRILAAVVFHTKSCLLTHQFVLLILRTHYDSLWFWMRGMFALYLRDKWIIKKFLETSLAGETESWGRRWKKPPWLTVIDDLYMH